MARRYILPESVTPVWNFSYRPCQLESIKYSAKLLTQSMAIKSALAMAARMTGSKTLMLSLLTSTMGTDSNSASPGISERKKLMARSRTICLTVSVFFVDKQTRFNQWHRNLSHKNHKTSFIIFSYSRIRQKLHWIGIDYWELWRISLPKSFGAAGNVIKKVLIA